MKFVQSNWRSGGPAYRFSFCKVNSVGEAWFPKQVDNGYLRIETGYFNTFKLELIK